MSDERPVNLSTTGLPSTVLTPEPAECVAALRDALAVDDAVERRAAVSAVVAAYPRSLDSWARLGDLARDDVEAYACYRVGYHRGLDALRASGWRGSGYVRWAGETNRGFLRALRGLRDAANRLGETAPREGVPIADYVAELAGRAEGRELWPYAQETTASA